MPYEPLAPALADLPAAPPAGAISSAPGARAPDAARTAGGVGMIAAAAVAGVVLLNTVDLPAPVADNAVAMGIVAAACVGAVRWIRGGVRTRARTAAAARITEFGGGVYGAIAAATLLYLEATDMAADVAAAGSLAAFLRSLNLDWLIQQAVESVGFAIHAAMWPWYWLSELGVQTAVMVAGAVWALDGAGKGAVARWRARGTPSPSASPEALS